MTNEAAILPIIVKYLNEPQNFVLKRHVEDYRNQSIANEAYYQKVEQVWALSERTDVLNKLDEEASILKFQQRISEGASTSVPVAASLKTNLITRYRWVAAAAIIIIIASFGYFNTEKKSTLKQPVYASDAAPGGNKAVLVLADGKKIVLSDVGNGDVAKQSGLLIQKKADGQLVYKVTDDTAGEVAPVNTFNTIETPKGGMWQVQLPDGTAVWLNAMSAITYPISFSKSDVRMVKLKGEAYFEVSKDKSRPFIVKTDTQEIEVLGTSFNINSYKDEAAVKTTLLEGSVKVKPSSLANKEVSVLVPGQQASLTAAALEITEVNTDDAVDWKNGYFMFSNEKQESIMRKLARWYNVEVLYADKDAKDVMYYGSVSRFDNVSQVLRKFEQTGEVRFEINKNKITVFKVD